MLGNLLTLLGWIFVGLALVGVAMPLVPATPFVLLAAACFYRASPAAYRRLKESRVLGPMLHDWQTHRGLKRSTKVAVFAVVAVAAAIPMLISRQWGIVETLATAGVLLTAVVLLVIPTVPARR
jgi:uncharacterized protein